jgi:hypothetical protein
MTPPLRLAALVARSIRGARVAPIRAAAERLLRPAPTDAEIAEAVALWEAVRADAEPLGAMLGLLRVLCEDEPRGVGLDRAVVLCAGRERRAIRESAGRAIFAAHRRAVAA